ncbi:hypothetical protein [Spongiimicrobium salis]|uniref:hypothetical protein n=1 Tax=Spongiimicrobium salis TaxID=1667022 RepID=UPI00374CE076
MSDLAHYSFLPWLRQGLSTKIEEKDTLGRSGTGLDDAIVRATLKVDVTVEDTSIEDDSVNETFISKNVHLVGPGDIVGLSDRAIVQTNPRKNITNFEANSLVYIDFYEEDFLWRYTPANPDTDTPLSARRLRPWLTLLVLKETEFELQKNPEGLAALIINDTAKDHVFPRHTETWAWGHVQMNQPLSNNQGNALTDEVNNSLEEDPDNGISRLLCPRKLVKSTAYSAFLIPAFETGRLAGLGEAVTGIKAQDPSWRTEANGTVSFSQTRPGHFPVYHQWSFHTGEFGDFESLVAVLEPIVMENDSGKMAMDIQSPGFALDGVSESKTLGMEGALKPPGAQPDVWPKPGGDKDFETGLQQLLNFSHDSTEKNPASGHLTNNPFYSIPLQEDPVLVPPTYGLHHAMIKKLGSRRGQRNPKWIESLNKNPTLRATAGLGTKTVQDKQEHLMHRAWQQIGEVNDANQKIREAELAKMASRALFNKHITSATFDKGLARTSAFHKRILNQTGTKTIQTDFEESRVPLAAKSAAFKRLTRPGKKGNKIMNKLSDPTIDFQKNLLLNFNADNASVALMAAGLKKAPENTLTLAAVDAAIDDAVTNYQTDDKNIAQETFFRIVGIADMDTLNRNSLRNTLNNLTDPVPSAGIKTLVEGVITDILTYQKNADNLGFIEISIKIARYKEVFGETSTSKFYESIKVSRPLEDEDNGKESFSSATSSQDLKSFQEMYGNLSEKATGLQGPETLPIINQLDSVYLNLRQKLDPKRTVERKISRRIKVWDNGKLVPIPKLKPIMAHPEFPEAVYEYLGKISQNFILPNIDQLPNNSLTLLESNQRFIEAYMAGLNHEMARELVWREFPTDKRGTYFRQFWNVKDNLLAEEGSSQLDIKKMHTWKGALGTHSAKDKPANLVLVVRGELLNKYPNTMVYAQKAKYHPNKPSEARELPGSISPENTKFPLFSAELEPDIMLFGFDLDAEEAKGIRVQNDNAAVNNDDAGWFFVFKERPGQITFGLDDFTDDLGNRVMPGENNTEETLDSWNDLAWEHLVDEMETLEEYQINFEKNLALENPDLLDDIPDPTWGSNSADLASILYQNPVIFARHAAEMLP